VRAPRTCIHWVWCCSIARTDKVLYPQNDWVVRRWVEDSPDRAASSVNGAEGCRCCIELAASGSFVVRRRRWGGEGRTTVGSDQEPASVIAVEASPSLAQRVGSRRKRSRCHHRGGVGSNARKFSWSAIKCTAVFPSVSYFGV
jgi:hypothetical protein